MSPIVGGVETFLINRIKRIDPKQIQFDFLTFCDRCAFEEELIARGSQVFHLTRRGQNPIRSYWEQRRFFKQHRDRYDFVWIHLCSASNSITHRLARRYTSTKIISHSHGTSFDSKPGLVRKLHNLLDRVNFKQFMRCTDYRFACSEAAGRWLFKGSGDVTIIKNGIDIDAFAFSPPTRDRIRKEWGIAEEVVAVGHLGRFCEAKNHTFLLDIFHQYHRQNSHSVLVLVGTGELEEQMKQKAKSLQLEDSVLFLGFRDDVRALYNAFDLFLLPSLFEGLPVSVIEAQTCELFSVISDSITREVDLTGRVTFLSLEQPAEVWAQAMLQLGINSYREQPIGRTRVAEQGYDVNQNKQCLERFFNNMTDKEQ